MFKIGRAIKFRVRNRKPCQFSHFRQLAVMPSSLLPGVCPKEETPASIPVFDDSMIFESEYTIIMKQAKGGASSCG